MKLLNMELYIFYHRLTCSTVPSDSESEQGRPGPLCTGAQTDLCLCCSHTAYFHKIKLRMIIKDIYIIDWNDFLRLTKMENGIFTL